MAELSVVWFERRGTIALGAVRGGGDKNAVLVDEKGGSHRVPRQKVLYRLSRRVPGGDPRLVKQHLRALRDELAPEAEPLDEDLLWSSLEEGRTYPLDELARLYLGEADERSVSRLARGLTSPETGRLLDAVRLRRGGFQRTDAATYDKIRERRRREAEIRAEEDAFLAWYEPVRQAAAPRPEGPGTPPEAAARPYEDLVAFALEGDRSERAKGARHLARRLGLDGPDAVLAELEGVRALPRHTNELPHRYGIPVTFGREALARTQELLEAPAPEDGEDLRELPTVAIDAPGTREVDDALSAWEQGGTTYLAVHISRAADLVGPGGALDREAQRRGTTVYFTREVYPMLPWELIQARLSLEEGAERPAVSLVCAVGPDALPHAPRFTASRIRVDRQLSYRDDPQDPLARGVLERLAPVAAALRRQREQAGAVLLDLPHVKFTLDAEGEPVPERLEHEGLPHLVVSELMVLYNTELARALAAAGRPALFRTQTQRVAPFQDVELPPDHVLGQQLARRSLPPTVVSAEPGPQHTLGVEAYVQGTSPIRRYGDLLAQRQLLSVLREEPAAPYDAAAVEDLRAHLEPLERRARMTEDERERYWLGRWAERLEEPLEALVSRTDKRPLVYVPALARELPVKVPDDLLHLGQPLRLRVRHVEPRQRILEWDVLPPEG